MKRPLVFIVDDDDDIREAFSEVLHDYGYDTHSYRNGREAVEALEHSERPSLILLDWMMPVMNGAEFVKHKEVGGIPVVVISAIADSLGEIPKICERMGKPVGLNELVHAVDRHCVAVTENDTPPAPSPSLSRGDTPRFAR